MAANAAALKLILINLRLFIAIFEALSGNAGGCTDPAGSEKGIMILPACSGDVNHLIHFGIIAKFAPGFHPPE